MDTVGLGAGGGRRAGSVAYLERVANLDELAGGDCLLEGDVDAGDRDGVAELGLDRGTRDTLAGACDLEAGDGVGDGGKGHDEDVKW